MYVSCRGTPFQICRSTMQPTIRAGRSHLPCGTIGRARLAEKMGGMGTGKRKPPHEGAGNHWRISLSFAKLSLFGLTFPDSQRETKA